MEFKIPTEVVELPSKGLLYPKDSPLSKGEIEMKHMTAREEDILTNRNFIEKGIAVDRLLKALITTPKVDYDEILEGDRAALLIAARIVSYGKDYEVEYKGKKITIDLSKIEAKKIDYSLLESGNNFSFVLPNSKLPITFKLLNHRDTVLIEQEVEGLAKISKELSGSSTVRLKKIITSVNGDSSPSTIKEFVEKGFMATDVRALRKEYARVSPDVDMNIRMDIDGIEEDVEVPIDITFFWPDARI